MKAGVIGGGLAGSEAAWALAEGGVEVTLYEMRPVVTTPAHHTDRLAEIVCSNSFKSTETSNAHGPRQGPVWPRPLDDDTVTAPA